jgi:hypothetical protein
MPLQPQCLMKFPALLKLTERPDMQENNIHPICRYLQNKNRYYKYFILWENSFICCVEKGNQS